MLVVIVIKGIIIREIGDYWLKWKVSNFENPWQYVHYKNSQNINNIYVNIPTDVEYQCKS